MEEGVPLVGPWEVEPTVPPWVDVSWTDIGDQLIVSLVVLFALNVLSIPMRFQLSRPSSRSLLKTVRRHLGTSENLPEHCGLLNLLHTCDFFASLTSVILWTYKTYIKSVPDWIVYVELATSVMMCASFAAMAMKHELCVSFLLSASTVIDALTLPALLYQEHQRVWLTLSFLRAPQVVCAYLYLEKSGVLDRSGEILRGVLVILVKAVAFLFTIAAVMFTLEVLGEFSFLKDKFTLTNMGPVSMYQMMYWMMTTVSTVGYGDFSPTTMPSRLWIFLVIPAGVIFFTVITGDIIELKRAAIRGTGAYYPNKGVPFVIVTGGALSSDSSTTVSQFLQELLHPNQPDRLEVVLMAPHSPKEWMRVLLSAKVFRGKLKYLYGHLLEPNALHRCKFEQAKMVFVLGDLLTRNADLEDERNAMIAAAVLNKNPRMKIRLLLLRPENKTLATNLGVSVCDCFAINKMKAIFLAQMCVNPGLNNLILNLLKKPIQGLDSHWDPEEATPPTWLQEYLLGTSYELYGCQLAQRFVGLPFAQIYTKAFQEQGVYIVALQEANEGSRICTCPMDQTYKKLQVAYVAASSLVAVDAIRLEDTNRTDWEARFLKMRAEHAIDKPPDEVVELGDVQRDRENKAHKEKEPASEAKHAPQPMMRLPKPMAGLVQQPSEPLDAPLIKTAHTSNTLTPAQGSVEGLQGSASSSAKQQKISAKAQKQLQLVDSFDSTSCTDLEMMLNVIIEGDHIVIILQDETLWQQLVTLLRLLRSQFTVQHPIVVITPPGVRPPPQLKGAFASVVYHFNNFKKLSTLKNAAGANAHMVMVVAGRPNSYTNESDMDREVLITTALLEKLHGDFSFPVPVAQDLNVLANITQLRSIGPPAMVHFLRRQMLKMARRSKWRTLKMALRTAKDLSNSTSSPSVLGRIASVLNPTSSRKGDATQDAAEGNDERVVSSLKARPASWIEGGVHTDVPREEAIFLHPRVASGAVISRADLLRMYGFAFHTPGCMELVLAFMDPEKSNMQMMPTLMSLAFSFWNMRVEHVLQTLAKEGIALLGVARSLGPLQDNTLPYTVGFPHKDMILHENDKLYVMAQRDLIRGSRYAGLRKIVQDRRHALMVSKKWLAFVRKKRRGGDSKVKPDEVISLHVENPMMTFVSPTNLHFLDVTAYRCMPVSSQLEAIMGQKELSIEPYIELKIEELPATWTR
mmetsp:Transcript_1656/g.2859  ORF Transcript_1656/g.2859 Transcript_1656/m.2859 type:complete len:1195 (-) Transcript_1656:59-3643(-)